MTAYAVASGLRVAGGREIYPNAVLDLIAAADDGDWIQLNTNDYDDVWPPTDLRAPYSAGTSNPATIIKAWSGFGWDTKRSRMYLWGGGHANSSGNELYVWDAYTQEWSLGYYPSDVVAVPDVTAHDTIDGARVSPISSHTYCTNQYLPSIDRFAVFGGAAHSSGGSMQLRDPVATDPALRAVGCYTMQLGLLGKGYLGGSTGSNPKAGAYTGVDLHGANAWELRDWMDPDEQNWSGFGARTNSGAAVRIESGKDAYYGMFSRNLYRIQFEADWRDDAITQVGRYWSAGVSSLRSTALHEAENLFISTGDAADPFTFWRLDSASPTNNDVAVLAAGLSGSGASGLLAESIENSGLTYDTRRDTLYFWPWGGKVYQVDVPSGAAATGWDVTLLVDPTTPRPLTKAEAESASQDANGVVGKWKYCPDLDVCIGLQHKTEGHVWAWKPIGWVDPRGA